VQTPQVLEGTASLGEASLLWQDIGWVEEGKSCCPPGTCIIILVEG